MIALEKAAGTNHKAPATYLREGELIGGLGTVGIDGLAGALYIADENDHT